MALGYRFCCLFFAAVSVFARWSACVGTIFVRAIETVLLDAFPTAAPHHPIQPGVKAEPVIGLAATRSYEDRRLQRIASELSIGRGLCLAA